MRQDIGSVYHFSFLKVFWPGANRESKILRLKNRF